MKRGKKYQDIIKKLDKGMLFNPGDAVSWIKENHFAKFDESVDVAINLGVDPRKADQVVRGTVVLPHGTGRVPRVLVFAQGEKVTEATEAGADYTGGEELVEKISNGWLDFDACIATPDMMKHVGKIGKILGPRKLMPSPKSGTVTFDIGKAVKDAKGGRIEYRTDKNGVVHCTIGRISFESSQLLENFSVLKDAIVRAKPASSKGKYIKSIYITTTMGPGVRIDPSADIEVQEVA
ncbi:MAG: 50S ribosomal protein L1 [Actinobacteria bacterium]|nr:50S ribosomal protein L1 [Actinomycetota bacterium]